MTLTPKHFFSTILGLLFLSVQVVAQLRPNPSPSPEVVRLEEQEPIRTITEEVQLTVTALDGEGRLDPTLELTDLLVLEDGVPQEIRSARRVPAHVLLLLDTGGELNSAKRVKLTREIARKLVTALGPQDEICVMQFNSKVETLQNWTIEREAVLHVLDTKLLSGKRARFVMITDGVQSPGERVDRTTAFTQLQASNAVVHVISYTSVSGQPMTLQRRLKRNRDKSLVPDDALKSVGGLGTVARRPGGVIFDMDPERRRQIKAYEDAMRISEKQLEQLSEESGGRTWLPESFEEMIDDGAEAARLIDSQYVVTYKPKRALVSAREGEVRRIDVASRRGGLHVVSRRQYFVPARTAADGGARQILN
jgi:hypothetical protein